MNQHTPKKTASSPAIGFSPINLPKSPAAASPQKNLTGLPRVVRDLTADIYNNIQKWNDLHIQGAALVKSIASIKAENPKNLSAALEEATDKLYKVVQNLRNYKDALTLMAVQACALNKLQTQQEPLFISLNIGAIQSLINDISGAYQAEFEVKEFVLENIAHGKNGDEAMFFAALWTYQYKITSRIALKLETLLVETGHRKIN